MDTAHDDPTLGSKPDAWWGSGGIDSMAWADGIPYGELAGDTETMADKSEATR